MNYADQIRGFKEKRAALVSANEAIMEKAGADGVTLTAEEKAAFDSNEADLTEVDDHIARLTKMEKAAAERAVPVGQPATAEQGAIVRGGGNIEVKGNNLPKGTAFTRYAMALARSKGNIMLAQEIAKGWHDSTPEVETVIKAAVAAGTTTDAAWAKPLVEYQNMASEFAELLRPATIIGRLTGLRRVPFNIKIPRQTAGSTVGWVGEGKPKPVSALAFDQITLGTAKTAGIVVISDELARSSSPAAEEVVRGDLIAQTAQFLDVQFTNPAVAASAGVSPASITNGVTPITASGTTADAFRADAADLFAAFAAANLSTAGCVWIMTEVMALNLSLMTNAFGQPEFPGLTAEGGTLLGFPAITSQSVQADDIIFAKPSEILLADDGQTMLDVSTEASLQMDSAPAPAPDATTIFTSLWQMNLVGIRAERYINWAKRRAAAVHFINAAAYAA